MKLEFLLCGSPTEAFFSQMAFFRFCLDALGGDAARARLVCTFGDHETETIPARWQPHFARLEVHWAHAPGAPNPAHAAQHLRRFDLLDPGADLSVICDADVAPLAPITPLAARLVDAQALAGVVAHYHFPWDGRPKDPAIDWPEIARAVLGRDIPRTYRYTLTPPDTPPEAPFYINFGMFAGPPAQLAAFARRDAELRPRVAERLGEWWAPQVSLALSVADLGLAHVALPMRYNYPNDPAADRLYPREMRRIVFLHYLRTKAFDRATFLADPEAFARFLEAPMEGSNAVFQRAVAERTGGRYPFG